MQDLRTAHLLIAAGYPASAGAVATSIFKLAYEIAWIGRDAHWAEQWNGHDIRRDPVMNYHNRMVSVLAARLPIVTRYEAC